MVTPSVARLPIAPETLPRHMPVLQQIQIEGEIRDDAVGFGIRASLSMLTKGRIERHLSQPELAAVIALAYEFGARRATLVKASGVSQ